MVIRKTETILVLFILIYNKKTMLTQIKELFTILEIKSTLKKFHDLAGEHSYFNPKLRIPRIVLYLHKFFLLTAKKKLIKLSLINSCWLYFNRYYPMAKTISLQALIEKKFPCSYKKTNDFLLSLSTSGSVLLNTFFTNASLLFICFAIKSTSSRKIVFLLPDELYKSSTAYLQSTCYTEYRELLDNKKVFLINMSLSSIEKQLELIKDNVIIINFLDTPRYNSKLFYEVGLLCTKLNFRADTLQLAAQMNMPIYTCLLFFEGFSLKTKIYAPYSLNILDFKTSVVHYTMEKVFAPLAYLLRLNPALWLNWFCLNDYKPIFAQNIFNNKKTTSRKMGLLNSEYLLWVTFKNNTYLLNLNKGIFIEIFTPAFRILLESKNIEDAINKMRKLKIILDSCALEQILSVLN